MKKQIVLLMALAMVVVFVACSNSEAETDDCVDIQIAADQMEDAKEYAALCFQEYLSNRSVVSYEITQTNYGFIYGDPVVFIIGYQYLVDASELLYGCQLKWNENQTFTVLEEGASAGRFIMR